MPRNPTPAQKEASRANGRMSRGPQGEAKRHTRWNSTKTGLRSKILALEYQSAQCTERSEVWYDYYQTQSPAAFHLANECAHASLLSDRCHKYRKAEIDKQRAAARTGWERQREKEVVGLAQKVSTNSEAAIAALATFGLGVRWVASCFQELIQEVQNQGYLAEDSVQWAVRLYGFTPTPEKICGDLNTYMISLYNLACTPGVGPDVIDQWLEPAHRPEVLRDKERAEFMGDDAEHCRDLLVGELEFELERLQSEEERLAREVDGPSLEAVLDQASILTEAAARRVARSQGESRASFHRALPQLYRTLDRDEERGSPEPVSNDDPEPADELAEEEAGDLTAAVEDAPGDVASVAAARAEEGAEALPIDPENRSDAAARTSEITTASVDFSAPARVRTEGDSSGVLAGLEMAPVVEAEELREDGQTSGAAGEAVENTPSEAPVEGSGAEGEGDDPSVEAPARSALARLFPVSACRRADSLLTEEEELAKKGSGQAVDSGESSVDGRPPGSGRHQSVSTPAQILQEPPLWGVAGLDPGHLPLSGNRELRLPPIPQGG